MAASKAEKAALVDIVIKGPDELQDAARGWDTYDVSHTRVLRPRLLDETKRLGEPRPVS